MLFKNHRVSVLALAVALAIPAVAAAEEGFVEDSHLKLVNRNYYFSQDFRNGDFAVTPDGKRQSRHAEWAHGVIANFESGFTQGTVGVGLDAHGLWAVKLDGGNGLVGDGRAIPGLISRDNDGEPKSQYGKAGGAIKLRAFDTELRYGDVRPTSPVLNASDIRLLPQTLRGTLFKNTAIEGLTLQGGKLESSSDRNASNHRGDLGTVYGGTFKDADDVTYLGGDYRLNDALSFKLHTSRLDDIWNQSFFSAALAQPLGNGLTFKTGLNYYRTRDTGSALLGEIDNDSWSARVGLGVGAHAFTLAYTRIDGDTPFDYVWNTYDIELDSASQVSDFNNPNERSWQARYDFDFVGVGIPGLSLTARYVRGSDIDGTQATAPQYSYFNGTSDGKHWERNFWATYVVQSGAAKDLSFNVMQATHRSSGNHYERDVDELRVIVQYPLDLRFL